MCSAGRRDFVYHVSLVSGTRPNTRREEHVNHLCLGTSARTSLRLKAAPAARCAVAVATATLVVAAWSALAGTTTTAASTALELATRDIWSLTRPNVALFNVEFVIANLEWCVQRLVVTLGGLEIDKGTVLDIVSEREWERGHLEDIPSGAQCRNRRPCQTSPALHEACYAPRCRSHS